MTVTTKSPQNTPLPLPLDWPSQLDHCAEKIVKHLTDNDLRIKKPIGEGGQGIVYSLENVKTGQISQVLKVTAPGEFVIPYEYNKGAHLVSHLQHPNLCVPTHFFYLSRDNTLTFTPEHGSTCVGTVMPFIQGESLTEKSFTIRQKAENVFQFGQSLTSAFEALRSRGLIHRDLHGHNILVDQNLKPVIIDFDLCARNFTNDDRIPDHQYIAEHLETLIRLSEDIRPRAKEFILACLEKAMPYQISPRFTQACLDHLPQIKQPLTPWARAQKVITGFEHTKPLQLLPVLVQAFVDHLDKLNKRLQKNPRSRL